MTNKTFPLRQGECPEGARGGMILTPVILPRPSATPSILEGEFVLQNYYPQLFHDNILNFSTLSKDSEKPIKDILYEQMTLCAQYK